MTGDWDKARMYDIQWVVTGNVPYKPVNEKMADLYGSRAVLGEDYKPERTLAEMMRTFVLSTGVEEQKITIGEGVGIASEARDFMEKLAGTNAEVHLVSSNWYLWPGKLIWKRHAKKAGVKIHFVPVYDTGRLKTKLLYFAYFLVVLTGKLFGFSYWLEDRLTKSQLKRKTEGFQMDGCA